ncbi:NADP-dependent oxidoreductase [Paraburkholderia sp. D15]|uniref:NADP-dependent oxidoreductase n=1 Tax=Paraburkholderia sp. D15 TaxID=2880218 RepID=UPI00247965BA|nr:NADP-dependent oxidoreductase [Paraburkholderia sp. D15]WGS54056.1 NADP-dependent oxidoreductase [Paraburkholderia sp. D15]
MTGSAESAVTMQAVRFHEFGEPADVLVMEAVSLPQPDAGRIRVRVIACGLNPADWALCRGLFAGKMPRGVGLDVCGIVDAIGEDVQDVAVGDTVLGAADYAGCTSAGAAEQAILKHWTLVPAGLSPENAAAIPLSAETAFRSIESLEVRHGHTVLIHGAGTTVGFAAVQLALLKGARVIATAGTTHSAKLAELGARVTAYGDGIVERVMALADGPVDLVLDTAPPSNVLPELVEIAGGDPKRVLTITDFVAANELGVRHTFSEGHPERWDMLEEFAKLAAEGKLFVPIAEVFPLRAWRKAMEISLSGHARGKLILKPDLRNARLDQTYAE